MADPKSNPVEIALVVFGEDAADAMPESVPRDIENVLGDAFPKFTWKVKRIDTPWSSGDATVDPLNLLSIGYHEKLKNHCDAAIVLTLSALETIANLHSRGIVSNALEVGVGRFSIDRSEQWAITPFRATLLLLGELWGEEVANDFISDSDSERPQIYSPEQIERISDRLDEISDARVEENSKEKTSSFKLIAGALAADPKSLFLDVIRYQPWAQPFRMGRLTAAAGVSTMVLILAAESWEVGVNIPPVILTLLTFFSLLISTVFLIKSQDWGWRTGSNRIQYEQEARTAWVVSLSIGAGMTFFGLVLFGVSLLVGMMITDETLAGWINSAPTFTTRLRYSVFTAAIGLLAATAGGNLEEERNLKARLLVDKEIP